MKYLPSAIVLTSFYFFTLTTFASQPIQGAVCSGKVDAFTSIECWDQVVNIPAGKALRITVANLGANPACLTEGHEPNCTNIQPGRSRDIYVCGKAPLYMTTSKNLEDFFPRKAWIELFIPSAPDEKYVDGTVYCAPEPGPGPAPPP